MSTSDVTENPIKLNRGIYCILKNKESQVINGALHSQSVVITKKKIH